MRSPAKEYKRGSIQCVTTTKRSNQNSKHKQNPRQRVKQIPTHKKDNAKTSWWFEAFPKHQSQPTGTIIVFPEKAWYQKGKWLGNAGTKKKHTHTHIRTIPHNPPECRGGASVLLLELSERCRWFRAMSSLRACRVVVFSLGYRKLKGYLLL